jgi:hypothetical protein
VVEVVVEEEEEEFPWIASFRACKLLSSENKKERRIQ